MADYAQLFKTLGDRFEGGVMGDFILAGIIALAVAGYLVYTLFHPEKF
jgi:K+-transporting ATPase KdpF subunit